MNTLYYGDNLKILRKYVGDESVDLIYLDPPFNSKRAYNVIFKDQTGKDEAAQIQAFEDTWSWKTHAQDAFDEIMAGKYPNELKNVLVAFKGFLGINNLMAYLVMMAIRLVEMHRVLKNTGSMYLHCDPTASHYLKILMDQIFGVKNFQHEIIWKRTSAHANSKTYGAVHQILFFYTKSNVFKFQKQFQPYEEEYKDRYYKYTNDLGRPFMSGDLVGHKGVNKEYKWHGITRPWRYPKERLDELEKEGKIFWTRNGFPRFKRYLAEMPGMPATTIWTDIQPVVSWSKETLGYPTQKPIALLERIIQASSKEGDVVMDPFCGCGTAVAAAEKLGRSWIGIDITHLAISLIKKRLYDHFPEVEFQTVGEPESVEAARELFKQSAFQFEAWAVSLLGGQPFKSKGGGDTGIDGLLYFKDYEGKFHKAIIEVKGGGYQPKEVRALESVLRREGAPIGVLIALNPPTAGDLSAAASSGKWKMPGSNREYPVLQIFTIEDYFGGKVPDLPDTSETLKRAKRELKETDKTKRIEM